MSKYRKVLHSAALLTCGNCLMLLVVVSTLGPCTNIRVLEVVLTDVLCFA